jgi:hypothetical protein
MRHQPSWALPPRFRVAVFPWGAKTSLLQSTAIMHERVRFAPLLERAAFPGVGPRVEEPAVGLIPLIPFAGPMDVPIKAAIAAGLPRRGFDVVTAQADGGSRLKDTALLKRATVRQRVRFSQDDDLLAIGRARQTTGVFFAGQIYGHQLAAPVGKYGLDLEVACQVLDPEDLANRMEYLL